MERNIDIVVGGQFGSEGKGKVTHFLLEQSKHKCAVRIGGCNSGHTSYGIILRHLPMSALLDDGICVIGAGSYLDLTILLDEILKYKPYKLFIDQNASMITYKEPDLLEKTIGSTLSGTGSGVFERVKRLGKAKLAKDIRSLDQYTVSGDKIHEIISNGCIIEGTQGFGLSVLHSPYYPFATSRDTIASGFASELGVSPWARNARSAKPVSEDFASALVSPHDPSGF